MFKLNDKVVVNLGFYRCYIDVVIKETPQFVDIASGKRFYKKHGRGYGKDNKRNYIQQLTTEMENQINYDNLVQDVRYLINRWEKINWKNKQNNPTLINEMQSLKNTFTSLLEEQQN